MAEEGREPSARRRGTGGWEGRSTGVALASFGLLLLLGAGIYFGYAAYAGSRLDDLTFSAEGYVASPSMPSAPRGSRDAAPAATGAIRQTRAQATAAAPDGDDNWRQPSDLALDLLAYTAAYPGVQMHPKYWHEPIWAGTDSRSERTLPAGFRAVSAGDLVTLDGPRALPTRIGIPMLELDSGVAELAIVRLGDSRAYETPKNIVGHIPGTAGPGKPGNGWYFGHLESPIRGEGSVFHRLPEIPGLLRSYVETGEDPVYISLFSEVGEYLYVVTATRVVPEDELSLYGSDDASITLVTCVPRLVYDYRLLVTARLVGTRG